MERNLEIILEALTGIELTESEMKTIRWLAGWDLYTAEQISRIINKCRK